MKTEVYSWRLSSELKQRLERAARRRKVPVSSVLETAVLEWLKNNDGSGAESDEEQQRRLHAAAEACIGTISGGDPYRSERVREIVRERLRRKYGR